MPSALGMRAANMALSDPTRREVFAFLRDEARMMLVRAADRGEVPLAAISSALAERFGAERLRAPLMRQFVGIAVSAILEEEGFALARTGVRLPHDPVFVTGARFERCAPARARADHALLARIIDGLTIEELAFAQARIHRHLRRGPGRNPHVREDGDELA